METFGKINKTIYDYSQMGQAFSLGILGGVPGNTKIDQICWLLPMSNNEKNN